MSTPDDRVTELEIRLMHVSRDQEQLSEVVLEQSREIEKLARSVELLRGKYRELLDALDSGDGSEGP